MCGIIGIHNVESASRLAFFGLFALQHRGQEASGIASSDRWNIYAYSAPGLVTQVYNERTMYSLPGESAIGHNRYATNGTGESQPITISTRVGQISIAHNGHIANCDGAIEDSRYLATFLGGLIDDGLSVVEAAQRLFDHIDGAFSLLILSAQQLIAMKDKRGIRPLCLGQNGISYCFASESCALVPLGMEYVRELEAGEMVVLNGISSPIWGKPVPTVESHKAPNSSEKSCLFELIYTARPDSILAGRSVYETRKEFGRMLAKRIQVGDIVVPVPDTGVPAAIGYSQATGIPIEQLLVKNRYIHRTFINPPETRGEKVEMKLSPIAGLLKDREVTLVDDSIVRGTTARKIVSLIRDAGASKVHFLVSSPPVRFPDQTGIDISDPKDLMAANHSIESIREKIGADTLTYLSLTDTIEATGKNRSEFYLGPFTGEY